MTILVHFIIFTGRWVGFVSSEPNHACVSFLGAVVRAMSIYYRCRHTPSSLIPDVYGTVLPYGSSSSRKVSSIIPVRRSSGFVNLVHFQLFLVYYSSNSLSVNRMHSKIDDRIGIPLNKITSLVAGPLT